MLPRMLGKNYDERRLKVLLVVLFLGLAVPTGAVLWQAYGQLKWEAFHQHRQQAEELTARIDADIAEGVATAEARSFAEYSFLNVSGEADTGFLQRSPLSALPVQQDLPGIIGYFQVDAEGRFSTPLLPAAGADSASLGIGQVEIHEREALASKIRETLVGNRLVEDGESIGQARVSQEFFDRLNERPSADRLAELDRAQEPKEVAADADPARQYGKVRDLKLDEDFQKKSEIVEEESGEVSGLRAASGSAPAAAKRSRRVEQAALPEAVATESMRSDGPKAKQEVRISTFESEIEPFEFSLLDSGQFVLFRKVWKEGERYVQGMLIDREAFLQDAVLSAYRATTLSAMSALVVGFGDDVIQVAEAEGYAEYAPDPSGMKGALLYRSRLSSPLDSIELIFSVTRLPAGPGASVLRWTTILLAAVFGLGFFALYRLAKGQIRLAGQQQDFVSSVSHELKTPLTSIRMYSEMLREGWADKDRRRQYYEFIHDESERLSRLISNVLQLASITRNEPSFELAPISVGELLDRIRSKISSQVERAGFELAVESDEDSARTVVEVDEDCMMQIVINLVDNAIKFSKDAKTRRIEIGAELTGNRNVRFSVRDFGPGIPREQMKKIFRLFYRPQSELTRETVGTGIGLAIVHQLTVAMGGKVDVLNREPGAEFRLTLPASRE